MRPRILDLFCGAGGAAMGYSRAGFDVVGVDINPQPNYPFPFCKDDALDFVREQLWWVRPDAIHASPPCQAYSCATPVANKSAHPDLVAPVREVLQSTGLPYLIENVVGAPLQTGFILCGSMFGMKVRRHRLFESNILIMPPVCDHKTQGTALGVYGDGGGSMKRRPGGDGGYKAPQKEWRDLMSMPWADPQEIKLAIPPQYTEFIGTQLLATLEAQ